MKLLSLLLVAIIICSASVTGIFNGIETTIGTFPHNVYIMVNPGTNNYYTCGGGLISERYILTAGHCSFGSSYKVLIGKTDIKGYNTNELLDIKSTIRPANFGQYGLFNYNDVAVFELVNPVKEIPGVVEFMHIGIQTPPVGTYLNMSGYGQLAGPTQTTILHKGVTRVAPDNECRFSDYRTDVSMCTNDNTVNTCPGDSGIPFVVKPKGYSKWVSVGIGSYSHAGDCGTKQPDTALGRVSSMISFIRQNTAAAPPTFVDLSFDSPTAVTVKCPYGYSLYSGYCYKLFPNVLSYTGAKQYCATQGGYLATITTWQQNSWINEIVPDRCAEFWIGGSRDSKDSNFKWDDRRFWGYENFDGNQPNSLGNYVSYIHGKQFGTVGKWRTITNLYIKPFMCQVPAL
ncbi:trypsin-like serine protease [Acrasis kona]|uniref:Trypsin-like serine protease n=1 Tax=Acrasis kona TaxID=1008807 RepID=A0AAW2YYL3_9EUKA